MVDDNNNSLATVGTKSFKISIPPLIRPAFTFKDQKWFWSEEWQKGEHQVNEELSKGEFCEFSSAEDAINELILHL